MLSGSLIDIFLLSFLHVNNYLFLLKEKNRKRKYVANFKIFVPFRRPLCILDLQIIAKKNTNCLKKVSPSCRTHRGPDLLALSCKHWQWCDSTPPSALRPLPSALHHKSFYNNSVKYGCVSFGCNDLSLLLKYTNTIFLILPAANVVFLNTSIALYSLYVYRILSYTYVMLR